MPVSLCEWRVRIGRFVHSAREYDIRERKEKLLMERIRRLKLLHKRLLDKKDKCEDKCESNQNELSAKVDNVRNISSIINDETPTDSHKEDSCSRSESTIEENTTQTESTTNHNSNGDDSTFSFFFNLLLALVSLLFSLIFFFVVDFSNLLESSKPLLNWGDESTWRSTCLRIIVCSSLAYIFLSCVINTNEEVQHNLVLIGNENAKVERIIKTNKTPTVSTNNENNTATGTTIKSDISSTESNVKEHNTQTESDIGKNFTLTDSRIAEKNTTTESTKECNNIPVNATITETNTPSTTRDWPSESKQLETQTSKRNIKEKNTMTELTTRAISTLPESTIRDIIAPKECHIDTPSFMKNKPSKRKTSKRKTLKDITSTIKCTIKEKNTSTESPIKGNNSTSESAIKDSNTTNKSAIKENNTSSRTHTEENNNQSMKMNIAQAEYTIRSGIQKECIHFHQVLSNGRHVISSRIPSSLKGTTDDPVMQESTCLPEMILVKAGDVEQNPGPFDRSTTIQEQELVNLAYDVPSSKYTELCIALGVSYNQSQNILDRHLLDFTRSLNAVFFKWKDRQRDGTDCRQVIAAALRGVNLDALGDKMSRGGYLPQEAAPTASIASEEKPLTTEQVTRCGDDFKTFYRTQLCKIKTDPLNFNLILEFETIYTDLVLLRNEQGTTKIPLDYKELLKTKVNGESPKRLMVEGEGGAGKTTFCSKMAWDWTNGADDFQEFVWVLVIPLRDIERKQTVGDIARTYLSDSNSVQPHQIDEYILANPSKVFIILDGLDEYDGDLVKQGNDIAKIIRSEKFKDCMVLVTTRPWKADQIKSNAKLMKIYAFIAVAGFDKKHISIYINKYFANDPQASGDLVKLIEENDVILENMAPFPIYIAMLCILWRDSDSKKRKLIRRLKTFSQLFQEIIISLKDHYVSKRVTYLGTETVKEYEQLGFCFSQIGKIALSGIIKKKLVYGKKDFRSCKEAMETCCKVGVLSHETRLVRRQDRHIKSKILVRENVCFPHKLFQEYLAGMYLASLFESQYEQYKTAISNVILRAKEFRYLLYFTVSQSKDVGIDVTNRINNKDSMNNDFLVDIAFEAFDEDAANSVQQRLFAEQKSLTVNKEMSAHTVSGYLFIMKKIKLEILILTGRSCGPTVSRDLADVICSSTALTALELSGAKFHDDFYGILESKINTSKVGASGHSIRKLHLDHRCHNDIQQHGFTVEMLFPKLEHLYFTSSQAVSPDIVGSLSHYGLKELSFATEDRRDRIEEDEEFHVPLVGDPSSLEQVFLNSFPLLTNLSFNNLVIGNNRCKIILSSLKQHQHLNNLRIILCYTDEEIDPIVSAINLENRMKVNIQRDKIKKCLNCWKMSSSLADALCHRTSIRELNLEGTEFSNAWFSEENQRTVDSKIQKLSIHCYLRLNDPTASHDLARFICLQPSLTDLTITQEKLFMGDNSPFPWLHDEFYQEIASLALSSKIEKVCMDHCFLHGNDPTASRDLAKFLCLLPRLTDLTITNTSEPKYIDFHDDFYHEIARLASCSKIEKVCIHGRDLLGNDPTSSRDLAKFLCLLPGLTDLTIKDTQYHHTNFHDDFYLTIARLASSSKIEKVCIDGWFPHMKHPTSSRDLAKFLCLLPCLTDLTIMDTDYQYGRRTLYDDFYHELARLASSSKIEKVCIGGFYLHRENPTASCDLAKFFCLLPCLTDLTIMDTDHSFGHPTLYDDFYHELARLASSSKIQKVYISGCYLHSDYPKASCDLAKFLCLLPCLTDLTIMDSEGKYGRPSFFDDFYHELARLASSSKNPFFINNWTAWYNEKRSRSQSVLQVPRAPLQTANLSGKLPSQFEQPNQHGTSQHQDLDRLSESVVSLESSVSQQSIDYLSPGPIQASYPSYQQCAEFIPDIQSNRNIVVQQPRLQQIEPATPQGTQRIHGYMAGEQYTSKATLQSSHEHQQPLAHSNREFMIGQPTNHRNAHFTSLGLEVGLQRSFSPSRLSPQLYPQMSHTLIPPNQLKTRTLQDPQEHPDQNRVGQPPLPFQPSHYISEPRAHTLSRPANILQAPPQIATRSQLAHLSGSQPFEQPNQPVQYFRGSTVQQSHFLPPQGPQDYLQLWQSQPLGDIPTASSSQMISPNTTRHFHQSATSGTFMPQPNTHQYHLQNQTHGLRHQNLSQTPVLQDTWQHPDQNRIAEPFLPFQTSHQQHQPILSQSQAFIQNTHQQPYLPQAPPQIATQSQITHLSGSQQSEQSNQLARRSGEPQVHPYSQIPHHHSQAPQHHPQQPQRMTEQPRYFSRAHSSYDDQRHLINPHQPMTHPIQRHTLQSETSTGTSLPPSSQPSYYHQTHGLHHPRQPGFSGNIPRSSRDPQQPNTHHNTVDRSRGPQRRHKQSP